MKIPTARWAALEILETWTRVTFPPALPEREELDWAELSPRERAQAMDLVSGILRWRKLLDTLLSSRLVKTPLANLDPAVHAALWIGAYQLLFQDQSAPWAAIDSAVELVRAKQLDRATGLVNAVLRGLQRLLPRLESVNQMSRSAFPRDAEHWVWLAEPIFPDPVLDRLNYLAQATSHPESWVRRLIEQQDPSNPATDPLTLLRAANQRPVIHLRSAKADFQPDAKLGLKAHQQSGFWTAVEGWKPALAEAVAQGLVSPQDPTSAKMVPGSLAHLDPTRPLRVLDLCAGLGTKTLQMAEVARQTHQTLEIWVHDPDAAKLTRLEQRLEQSTGTKVHRLPENRSALLKSFDLVLVDAPCSNSGVFARRPQARWRWARLELQATLALQSQLVEEGFDLLVSGGLLAYATCSLDRRENDEVVAPWATSTATLVCKETTYPTLTPDPAGRVDGGFWALLRKA